MTSLHYFFTLHYQSHRSDSDDDDDDTGTTFENFEFSMLFYFIGGIDYYYVTSHTFVSGENF